MNDTKRVMTEKTLNKLCACATCVFRLQSLLEDAFGRLVKARELLHRKERYAAEMLKRMRVGAPLSYVGYEVSNSSSNGGWHLYTSKPITMVFQKNADSAAWVHTDDSTQDLTLYWEMLFLAAVRLETLQKELKQDEVA